eukprot:39121_1
MAQEKQRNPYIDESLIIELNEYNAQQNKAFEKKHTVDAKQKSKYGMHPFSRKILDYNDDRLLTMIRRDKAPNPVVYRARFKKGRMELGFESNPVDIFWLKITKRCVAKHRQSGKQDDRVEVSYIESKLAYGIQYQQIGNKQEYKIVFNALPKWKCVLKICPKQLKPKIFGHVNGKACYLRDIHVKMAKKNWLGIPSIEYVTLKGFTCINNAYIEHRINP